MPGPVRVCFVCSGNICRSPMAEVVLVQLAAERGLDDRVVVESAGTGDWHVGEPADPRAVTALRQRGYDGEPHRAREFEPAWFGRLDLVVALDRGHARTLRSWAPTSVDRAKVRMLRAFDPTVDGADVDELHPASAAWADVPDPYYDGPEAFDHALDLVEAACRGLLDQFERGVLPGSTAGAPGVRGS